MDKLQFNHPGGFPLDTDTLKKMQDAWNVLALLATGFGDNIILSGCEAPYTQGGAPGIPMITDGVIILNGELLPFDGGLAFENNIKVVDIPENIILETGESVVFRKKRVAKLSPTGTPLNDFIRLKNLAQINSLVTDLSNDKVDKEQGKGLSENDFTDTFKQRLSVLWDNLPNLELKVSANGEIISRTGKFEGNVTVERPEDSQGLVMVGVYHVYLDGFSAQDLENANINFIQLAEGNPHVGVREDLNCVEVETASLSIRKDRSFILTMYW